MRSNRTCTWADIAQIAFTAGFDGAPLKGCSSTKSARSQHCLKRVMRWPQPDQPRGQPSATISTSSRYWRIRFKPKSKSSRYFAAASRQGARPTTQSGRWVVIIFGQPAPSPLPPQDHRTGSFRLRLRPPRSCADPAITPIFRNRSFSGGFHRPPALRRPGTGEEEVLGVGLTHPPGGRSRSPATRRPDDRHGR
jgi:hypothetical protein